MNIVGAIPDIPKVYTALAEWMACFLYIIVCNRRFINRKEGLVLTMTLGLLIIVQMTIGVVPTALWIPGMVVALVIMFIAIRICCEFSVMTASYWLIRAFVLAEFAASLEWQLYYFFSDKYQFDPLWFQVIFLLAVYGGVYGSVYVLEVQQDKKELHNNQLNVTSRDVWSAAVIGIIAFTMSNLSYVYSAAPFSSPIATEAFNIRTLVGLGGFAFLYAYHLQRCEYHMKAELDAIQNILHTQYAQYRQSKESIDIINHKYHDLKHQIAILRSETNPDKRESYLAEMEQGIKDYELQYKTGNAVLDTVLTGKSLYCARHDITLTCVADGSLLQSLYVMDICTIFGNALDNAIEYELQIEDPEKRLIHVLVSELQRFITIKIENYFEGELQMKDDLPVTTKNDKAYHGFGLKSIQYSAQKYNGTVTVNVKDNWFELTILIPVNA